MPPVAYFLGDSITQGSTVSFVGFAASRLGWSAVNGGIGGTGFLNITSGDKFRDRIATVAAAHPDIVVIEGGTNDTSQFGFTDNQFDTELALFKTAYDLILPNAVTFVLSPWPVSRTAYIAHVTAQLQSPGAATGQTYIDLSTWITGTGNEGSPAGDGNADVFIKSDGVHLTDAGAFYVAQKFVDAVRASGALSSFNRVV